jgi:hypothetical protein
MSKKNALITIPKTLMNVYLFPSFISNGHWAVKKSRVNCAAIFETEAVAKTYFKKNAIVRAKPDDAATNQINTSIGEAALWSATRYIETTEQGLHRFFINSVTGELAQFDCAYLKLFGLDNNDAVLWGSNPNNAFRDTQKASDMTLLIMPIKFESKNLTVFQAA